MPSVVSAVSHTADPSAIPSVREFVDAGLVRRLLYTSQICALTVTTVGALVLIGWQADIELFKSIYSDLGADVLRDVHRAVSQVDSGAHGTSTGVVEYPIPCGRPVLG